MSNTRILVPFLLGAAIALLLVKVTPLGDYFTQDYPPGPRPAAIRSTGAVVTVDVKVKAKSTKRFVESPLNRIYVTDMKFLKPDLKLTLTKDHVQLLNDALGLGGERVVPLPFTLSTPPNLVKGEMVHVQTLLLYDLAPIADGSVLIVTDS